MASTDASVAAATPGAAAPAPEAASVAPVVPAVPAATPATNGGGNGSNAVGSGTVTVNAAQAKGREVMHAVHSNDSRSLWNYTLSPGWTEREVEVFRLALMKFGVGRWSDIVGCLPGKTAAQLNNQAQRMLGQQSTSEFTGLNVDLAKIFADNKVKRGMRKSGCLINMEDNPTQEQIRAKRLVNQEKYGLDAKVVRDIVIPVIRHDETSSVMKDTFQNKATTRLANYDRLRQLEEQLANLQDALRRVRAGEDAGAKDAPKKKGKGKAKKAKARVRAKAKPGSGSRSATKKRTRAPRNQEDEDMAMARRLQMQMQDDGFDDDNDDDAQAVGYSSDDEFEPLVYSKANTTKRQKANASAAKSKFFS